MECPKCHTENQELRKFCRKCGNRLAIPCPHCNFENLPGDEYCGECGSPLRATSPPLDPSRPSSYTPKHLADQILTSRSALEGEHKIVTVLFADVAGFTSISDKLDPEEVHQILDGCFQILMTEIHRYEGTINQFTGDGVMALFGAPLSHEDHAQRACHAALAIQKAMEEYSERLKREYGIDFRLRIGLNSGPVVVGKIGDDLRMDYTAIGDTTNLASRMQSLAQPGTILLSSKTYRFAKEFFQFQPLGKIEVKGKEKPQEVYQLLGLSPVETRLAAAAVRGLTRFIGREKEMQILSEAYEKVQSSSGQVVSIVGEAGVGKSRLLLEFRQSLPESLYLEGRCLHYGSSMAYLPLLDILRSYLEIKEGDPEALIKERFSEKILRLDLHLQKILPPLQDLLSLKVEDQAYLQLDPRQKKERTFEALRDLFLRQSQERPLILSIEDLHWLDKASEEFLGYLIEWLAKAKILLLLLYRPEYTHPWANKSYYHRIGLDQLSLDSSAELVQAILVGGDVAPELRQLILERAAGNPLFMEEMTHALLESGSIQRQDHRYLLTQKPSEISVPDTIQGVIAARMDHLEESNKRTLQAASVIGREFAYRILQAISEHQEELKSRLLHLQRLEFIYEKALFPELEYLFKHALTQEVAYGSLLLKRRKEVHERIGRAIEEIYSERVEEFSEMLAFHYERAGIAEKAVKYLHLAGERAVRLSANEEAIRHFNQGLELIQTLPESRERDERELGLQLALYSPVVVHLGWGASELGRASSRALELCRRMGETPLAFMAHMDVFAYCWNRAEHRTALELAEQLLRLAQRNNDSWQMGHAHWAIGVIFYFYGRLRDAKKHLEHTYNLCGCDEPPSLGPFGNESALHILIWVAYTVLFLGYPEQALNWVQEAIKRARQIDHPFSVAFALAVGSVIHRYRCEPKADEGYAAEVMRLAIEGRFLLLQGFATFDQGWVLAHKGQAEEGIRLMHEGIARYRSTGQEHAVAGLLYYLAEGYMLAGRAEDGFTVIQEAMALVEKTGERISEAEIYRVKGELLQLDGRLLEAEASFRHAIEVARSQEAKFLELRSTIRLGHLLQKDGRCQEARQLLSEIYDWFTEGFDTPDMKEAKALLEEIAEGGQGFKGSMNS